MILCHGSTSSTSYDRFKFKSPHRWMNRWWMCQHAAFYNWPALMCGCSFNTSNIFKVWAQNLRIVTKRCPECHHHMHWTVFIPSQKLRQNHNPKILVSLCSNKWAQDNSPPAVKLGTKLPGCPGCPRSNHHSQDSKKSLQTSTLLLTSRFGFPISELILQWNKTWQPWYMYHQLS